MADFKIFILISRKQKIDLCKIVLNKQITEKG